MKLVLASANPDKAREIADLMSGLEDLELIGRPEGVADVVEDGDTLEANARLKAAAVMDATGLPAVADDTGLEVEALGGAPGVMTARYAGEHATYAENANKLLLELRGVTDRRARFRTIALVAFPDGRELVAEGSVEGEIATAPRGEGGFGYDPIFLPSGGDGRTFAEMSLAEKRSVSHRGLAFRALGERLRSLG